MSRPIRSVFKSLCLLRHSHGTRKTCDPATTLSFAGIELDSICSEARSPLDKIHRSTQLISEFLGRKKVSLKEVQSLTGLLNFACSVIKPGRAFLRRLIDLTVGIRSPHHLIRLTKEVKEDLKVWLSFLAEFNGRSFFIDDAWQNSSKLPYTRMPQVHLVLAQFLAIDGAMGNGHQIGLTVILPS